MAGRHVVTRALNRRLTTLCAVAALMVGSAGLASCATPLGPALKVTDSTADSTGDPFWNQAQAVRVGVRTDSPMRGTCSLELKRSSSDVDAVLTMPLDAADAEIPTVRHTT